MQNELQQYWNQTGGKSNSPEQLELLVSKGYAVSNTIPYNIAINNVETSKCSQEQV